MKIVNVVAALLLSAFGTHASAVSITDAEVRELRSALVAELLPNCVGVETFYDQVYCSSKIYFVFDETLNEAYSDLRKELSSADFDALRDVQRVWVKKRDDKCARLDGNAVVMNLQCAIKMTATSLWYLMEIKERPLARSELIAGYKGFTEN